MTDRQNSEYGTERSGILFVSPAEAAEWLENEAVLIDLRKPYETLHRTLDVPEICFIPWNAFDQQKHELPLDKPLVLMDNVGIRSKRLYSKIKASGVKQAAVLSGGVLAWIDAGLPVMTDKNYALSGQCSCRLRPRKPYSQKDVPSGKK